MMMVLYTMMMTVSIMFSFTKHPLSMGFTLLIQVILVAAITGTMSLNFWFSYILFMIMVGGMLVLFIYMTSVASNEKFKYSNKLMMLALTALMVMVVTLTIDPYESYQLHSNTDTESSTVLTLYNLSLSKYLNYPTNLIMLMMIVYLLIALIAVVKITNISYGPLRQKF